MMMAYDMQEYLLRQSERDGDDADGGEAFLQRTGSPTSIGKM